LQWDGWSAAAISRGDRNNVVGHAPVAAGGVLQILDAPMQLGRAPRADCMKD
jgi:hypothetical protein